MNPKIESMQLSDYELLHEILKYKESNTTNVINMQNFLVRFIDISTIICHTCPAQIRYAHKRIKDWYSFFENEIEGKFAPVDKLAVAKAEVDNYTKNKCVVCQTNIFDGKKRYCSKKCKDLNKDGNK